MATQHDESGVWAIPADLRLQLLAALSRPPDQLPEMSYDEFLEWATEDTYAEWVDGKVIMPSPANSRHQMIVSLLSTVLPMFVGHHRSGQIFSAPYQMKLAHAGREPDILFLATEHFDRIGPVYLHGPADLVIEVISPDSIGRDRGDKFYEYQAAGIPEYG